MSLRRSPEVWCDGDLPLDQGCAGNWTQGTRKQARHEGWGYKDGKDYCPVCAEALGVRTNKSHPVKRKLAAFNAPHSAPTKSVYQLLAEAEKPQ